ncbi:MAG: hypothetical protein ACREMG_13510 [Gemmatimonadales bacterium]
MAEHSFTDQVAVLNTTLRAIEGRVALREVPPESLQDVKSSLDDIRLRLWALLGAAGADDFQAFQERFRIRRAKEMCRGLDGDLRAGLVSARHSELPELRDVALHLATGIDAARRDAF